MRILHIIPSLAKGGAERYCADVCAELHSREGIEVLLVAMDEANAYSFITDQIPYKVCYSKVLLSVSGKHIVDTEEYDQIVADFKPDIIHSHLFWAELLSRYRPLPGVKYVTHCQNNMPEFRNISLGKIFSKSTWTTWYEKKWIIKKYKEAKNNFLVISKDTEKYYYKTLPVDLQRITLMYHAIQFERFYAANKCRLESLNRVRLIYVARFAVYKNHTFLVDIVEELRKRRKDTELDFLGNGELYEEVKTKVEEKGLSPYIHFRGVVDDVETYLQKANIYVHPAYYEPFGLVLVEAMAAGLPAVCLDGKGNRDLIEQGKNGYMFFEQNAAVFADCIEQLIASPAHYETMARYATEYARGFDIGPHTDRLIDYYKSI